MSETRPTILIVDDDAAFGKSLSRLVKSIGFDVEVFVSADDFLEREPCDAPCCLKEYRFVYSYCPILWIFRFQQTVSDMNFRATC